MPELFAKLPDLGVLVGEVRVRVGHGLQLDERAQPLTSSRWIRTVSHSSRCRRFSTTTSTPSVSVSAASIPSAAGTTR